MVFQPYKSKQWFDFRKAVIGAKKSICEECGIGNSKSVIWQVHHPVYKDNAMIWEYELHEVMLVCKGCHAKLHGFIQPSSGWSLEYEDDLGSPDGICDRCGRDIRFTYQIDHENWSTMIVGSGCCDRLTESSVGSERKAFLERLEQFANLERWEKSDNRYFRKYKGFTVTVALEDGLWKLFISSKTGTSKYHSPELAKRAALQRIEIQLEKEQTNILD